jgi:hypothetical protein
MASDTQHLHTVTSTFSNYFDYYSNYYSTNDNYCANTRKAVDSAYGCTARSLPASFMKKTQQRKVGCIEENSQQKYEVVHSNRVHETQKHTFQINIIEQHSLARS